MEHHHKPLYRFVLRDALLITWRNKFLWLLGFFVALLGNLGIYGFIVRAFDASALKALALGGRVPNFWSATLRLRELALQSASWKPVFEFILVVLGLAIIFILYFVLSSLAMAAAVLAVKKLAGGKKTNLAASVSAGPRHLMAVLAINFFSKLIIWLVLSASALPLGWLLFRGGAFFGIFYVFSFVVLISFGLAVSFLAIYAVCFSALQGQSTLQAARSALKIFANNVVISVEMALVLFFINLLYTLVVLTALVTLGGILAFILVLLAGAGLKILFWTLLGLGILMFVGVLILAGSFFGAFELAAWTILCLKLARGGMTAKIVRLARRFPKLLHFKKF